MTKADLFETIRRLLVPPKSEVLIVCCLLSPSAMADSVRVDSTPGIDFRSYKRYTWRDHPVFEKRPELAEKYSVGIELVKNAGNQNLMGRGFQSTRDARTSTSHFS